eukprot:CAMPEP_0175047078 /NCGR_PEP_ID=MMETSP0052_2-20121109/5389_1 /TAXON_ID=51329 ORGANISM="Polytomella parva, Strain SAG 63-3" /NCGR_SAMPLE_ID=MMETSP0052_2 /ASSEMBLY_ACC=CAM_ASM_000194 /LENGTH=319 /DNA_ID=CAMNT_0016310901 /DNA_START=196 /DNA_END=1151 /DNA_ORIENTATION=+
MPQDDPYVAPMELGMKMNDKTTLKTLTLLNPEPVKESLPSDLPARRNTVALRGWTSHSTEILASVIGRPINSDLAPLVLNPPNIPTPVPAPFPPGSLSTNATSQGPFASTLSGKTCPPISTTNGRGSSKSSYLTYSKRPSYDPSGFFDSKLCKIHQNPSSQLAAEISHRRLAFNEMTSLHALDDSLSPSTSPDLFAAAADNALLTPLINNSSLSNINKDAYVRKDPRRCVSENEIQSGLILPQLCDAGVGAKGTNNCNANGRKGRSHISSKRSTSAMSTFNTTTLKMHPKPNYLPAPPLFRRSSENPALPFRGRLSGLG